MPWLNWSTTVASCVSNLTQRLRVETEASYELFGGYPLGWRLYGVPRAIAQLRARGFDVWVTDGDVIHARRMDGESVEGVRERRGVLVPRR